MDTLTVKERVIFMRRYAYADTYVICPHCGYKNTVYGYGEDDD